MIITKQAVIYQAAGDMWY